MTELDGTPILERSVDPRRHHGRLLAVAAAVGCLDLAFRLAFIAPVWDGLAQAGILPTMLVGLFSGPLIVLLPAAFVLRSPDAWRARRLLVVGLVLAAAGELGHSAINGLLALNTWELMFGQGSFARELMSDGPGLDRLAELSGIVGTLAIAIGLGRLRRRQASRRARGLIAAALLVGGLLALGSLRPILFPRVVESATWWVMPALLTASQVARVCEAWVIFAGWWSAEPPRRPWVLAAAAMSIGLVSSGLMGGVQILGLAPLVLPVVFVVSLLGVGGGLLFLAALADGLGSSQAAVAPAA